MSPRITETVVTATAANKPKLHPITLAGGWIDRRALEVAPNDDRAVPVESVVACGPSTRWAWRARTPAALPGGDWAYQSQAGFRDVMLTGTVL